MWGGDFMVPDLFLRQEEEGEEDRGGDGCAVR